MSSVRRLQAMYESKQQDWELVHDRLTSLRQAKLIETDPGNQFKLDRQIKTIEQELSVIQEELTQLEQQLSRTDSSKSRDEFIQTKPTSTKYQYHEVRSSTSSTPLKRRIIAGFLIIVGIGLIGFSLYILFFQFSKTSLPIVPIMLYGVLGLMIGGGGFFLWK
ncbi:hypothetical protein [Nostoc sp. CENA543]|uniref:hypothetical protein n=1 Tax=Nostoc sp. CENA543 TaxID=1869241 RepID=UPI00130006ED|nr:hypothetical protein [Nostoc sp. CENA543]